MRTLTIHDQAEADALIPAWLAGQAEPGERWIVLGLCLRGPVDLGPWLRFLDGVTLSGETGPDARPLYPQWVRDVRDACIEAGVEFCFESWGEWKPVCETARHANHDIPYVDMRVCDGWYFDRCGAARSGRTLDGREWLAKEEW